MNESPDITTTTATATYYIQHTKLYYKASRRRQLSFLMDICTYY